MNKKIKQYSAIALAAAAVIPMSCKKESDKKTTPIDLDDPNITVRSLNLTLKDNDPTKRVSSPNEDVQELLDIDNNGTPDFTAVMYYFKNGADNFTLYSAFVGKDVAHENKISAYYIVSDDIPMANSLTTSEKMQSSTPSYYAAYTSLYEKDDGDVIYDFQSEFKGKGDKFVGVKFKIGTDFHYGWMKINLSSDARTLVISEVAYDTRANTPITIGAR